MNRVSSIKMGDFEFIFNVEEGIVKNQRRERQRKVMQEAWRRARRGAERFGGKASDYIGEAMKQAAKVVPQVKSPEISEKDVLGEGGKEPITTAEAEFNVLYNAVSSLSNYLGDTGGAALEVQNANNFKEFLSDLKSEIGAEGVIENLRKAGKSVYEVTQMFQVLVQAHYDHVYASWAGGTETFKNELRKVSEWLAGDSSRLVDMFF